ncbi:DUF5919 domain-containing protein [Nocardia sp. NPDC001965]
MPPQQLFECARTIDMVGISLNLMCQQYPEHEIYRLLDSGAEIRCLLAGTAARWTAEDRGHRSAI